MKAQKIGIMWNKDRNMHGERYGNSGKTEGRKQRKERKSEEEGETGVQQQLRQKVVLEYGGVCSEGRVMVLTRTVSLSQVVGGHLLCLRRWNRGFHDPHRIRPSTLFILLELQLSRLLDKLVHVAGFSGEESGVLEKYMVLMVHTVFCHCQLFRMAKANVPVMLFNSGLCELTSLSNVHLATFIGDAIHTRSPQPQVILHRM
jgi:hypothetical protein